MSGLEVVAFVLGALGSLQQALDALTKLKQRLEATSTNATTLSSLHASYTTLSSQLHALHAQLENNLCRLPAANIAIFEREFATMKQDFQQAVARLNDLLTKEVDQTRPKRVRTVHNALRFFRATSTKDVCADLQEKATRAAEAVGRINALLSTPAVIEPVMQRVADRQTEAIVQQVSTLTLASRSLPMDGDGERIMDKLNAIEQKVGANRVQEDAFVPAFIGPVNPPLVKLRFDAVGDDGEPQTFEARMKAMVLSDEQVVGATGKGGVGKSCTLIGLREEADVRSRFWGGVYYMLLGMNATIAEVIEQLAAIVERSGGLHAAREIRYERKLSVAIGRTAKWFQGKDSLFIIDNLWKVNDVDSGFLARVSELTSCSPTSTIAFSTRDALLGSFASTVQFFTRPPLGNESRSILLTKARFQDDEIQDQETENAIGLVLAMCDGLPLALSIAGNSIFLRTRMYPAQRQKALTSYLSMSQKTPGSIIQRDIHGYPAMTKTLPLALQNLDDQNEMGSSNRPLTFQTMYRALCVLQKGAWAPLSMLSRLWKLRSCEDAMEIVALFEQMSLLACEVHEINDRDEYGIRLHDLCQECCIFLAEDYEGVVNWHRHLLEAYRSSYEMQGPSAKSGCREWWKEEDAYVLFNVSHHLLGCGRALELLSLLLNPQWTAKQLVSGNIAYLEQDFMQMIITLRNKGNEQQSDQDQETCRSLELISKAARLSFYFVLRNPKEVWFQLYGRLLGVANSIRIDEFLLDIDKFAQRPWVKPLRPCLPGPESPLSSTVACRCRAECMCVVTAYGHVALGLVDGTVFVINAESGDIVRIWNEHTGLINCISVVEYGKTFATGSDDKTARIWSLETGRMVGNVLKGHEGPVRCVAASGDGTRVVTGSEDGTAIVWAVQTSAKLFRTLKHGGFVVCVGLNVDGSRMVTGSYDCSARIWDPDACVPVCNMLEGHKSIIASVAVVSENCYVVTASVDGEARIWDLDTGKCILEILKGGEFVAQEPRSFRSGTARYQYQEASHQVVTSINRGANWKKLLRKSDKPALSLKPMETGKDTISSVALSADGKLLFVGLVDFTAHVIALETEEKITAFVGHCGSVTSYAASSKRELLVTGSIDGTARVWNMQTGEQVGCALQGHTRFVRCVAILENLQRVVSASDDNSVRVWEINVEASPANEAPCETSELVGMQLLPDGKTLITISRDGTIRSWCMGPVPYVSNAIAGARNVIAGQLMISDLQQNLKRFSDARLGLVPGIQETVRRGIIEAEYSEDGLFMFGTTGTEAFVEKAGEYRRGKFRGHADSITCLSCTPDGKRLVTGSEDHTARVWDAVSGKEICALEGCSSAIRSVAITPDGSRVATGSEDSTVRIWKADTGRLIHGFNVNGKGIRSIFLAASGETAVTGSGDGFVRVWNAKKGKCPYSIRCDPARLFEVKGLHEYDWQSGMEAAEAMLSFRAEGTEIVIGYGSERMVLATLNSAVECCRVSAPTRTLSGITEDYRIVFLKLET